MLEKRPRILHLIYSQQRRGAEVFAAQLVSHIQDKGRTDNAVCSLFVSDDFLGLDGVPSYPLNGRKGIFKGRGIDPKLAVRLLKTIRRTQPDLLVAHGSHTLKYAASAGLMLRNLPIVYRNIGTASYWANSSLKVNFNRLMLTQMDAVVSVSEYTRRDFIDTYRMPADKVKCIPMGIDLAQFNSNGSANSKVLFRKDLGLTSEDITLVTVGSLSPEKGHREFLPLIKELKQEGLPVHLLMVGDGPLRHELEEKVRELSITQQVHFLGQRTDIARVMNAADIFVLPSKTEGMPGVLIEAGLAGLPSVSFNVGGVTEVIEDGVSGLAVTPGNCTEMSRALVSLIEDPQRRGVMGNAAQKRCHQHFGMPKVASQYEELFLNMTTSSSGEKNVRA